LGRTAAGLRAVRPAHVIGSWIGTGPNLPVTADQRPQALGSARIAAIAQLLGMPPGQITAQLAQLRPKFINQLTPNGPVPSRGIARADAAGTLTAVLGRLAGGVSPPVT